MKLLEEQVFRILNDDRVRVSPFPLERGNDDNIAQLLSIVNRQVIDEYTPLIGLKNSRWSFCRSKLTTQPSWAIARLVYKQDACAGNESKCDLVCMDLV